MKRFTETELAKELRQQYIKNPPEGMTSDEVLDMSDDDLLDMDYFLHEFDDDDDDWGTEGFYSYNDANAIGGICVDVIFSKYNQ